MIDHEKDEEPVTKAGSAATNVSNAGNASGELRPPPEIGASDEAASRESRRIAEEEGTET